MFTTNQLDEIIKEVSKLNIKKQTPKINLSEAERNALKQLKTNRDIVIKEADKGGAIVIMTKEQYSNMVMKHLNTDTYEAVTEKNIDKKVMKKIEDFTSTYSHLLKEREAEYLTNFKFSTSNFYMLPKVDKRLEITKLVESNPVDYLKIKDPPEIGHGDNSEFSENSEISEFLAGQFPMLFCLFHAVLIMIG